MCAAFLACCIIAGCSRVTIVTGTTLGIKATPGDGNTQPPQVTLGYKRAETALIPTEGKKATRDASGGGVEAYSTLAAFFLQTAWFGDTEVASFISTGHAARDIQKDASAFNTAFAARTLGELPDDIRERRRKLSTDSVALDASQLQRTLDLSGCATKPGKNPQESFDDCIKAAQTDAQLQRLESAIARVR